MFIISEKNLADLVNKLKDDFEFFDARQEELPFKKYFLSPVEEIFPVAKPPKKFILYGLNLLDLEALTYLDEIMKKPNEDFYYLQRRKQAIVIGITNERTDAAPGGDIVFQKIDEGKYRVWENTIRGKNFIGKYKIFFEEIKDRETEPVQSFALSEGKKWTKTIRELLADSELLASAVRWSWKNPIWDELEKKCIGCGICTYVCPLCYCFSIEDRISLDDKCSRCRKWTSCILPEFSKIAGGHSFKPTLRERYYNWFYHKFVRAYKEYGKSQCVGCGRCKKYCPANIDIKEVLEKILEDYKKQNIQ